MAHFPSSAPSPGQLNGPSQLPQVAAIPALPRVDDDLDLDSINEVMEQTGGLPLAGTTLTAAASSPPLPAGRGGGAERFEHRESPRAEAAANAPRPDIAWLESLRPANPPLGTGGPQPSGGQVPVGGPLAAPNYRPETDWPNAPRLGSPADALAAAIPPATGYDPYVTRPSFDVPATGLIALPGSQGPTAGSSSPTVIDGVSPLRGETTPTRYGDPVPLLAPGESLEDARRRRLLARLTGFFAGLIPGLLMAAWFSMKDREDGIRVVPNLPGPALTILAPEGFEVMVDASPAPGTFPMTIPLNAEQSYRVKVSKTGGLSLERTIQLPQGGVERWFVADPNSPFPVESTPAAAPPDDAKDDKRAAPAGENPTHD